MEEEGREEWSRLRREEVKEMVGEMERLMEVHIGELVERVECPL